MFPIMYRLQSIAKYPDIFRPLGGLHFRTVTGIPKNNSVFTVCSVGTFEVILWLLFRNRPINRWRFNVQKGFLLKGTFGFGIWILAGLNGHVIKIFVYYIGKLCEFPSFFFDFLNFFRLSVTTLCIGNLGHILRLTNRTKSAHLYPSLKFA